MVSTCVPTNITRTDSGVFNFLGICWKAELSNNSSNKFISGAFLLQCCDDQLGNIGIILQQLIGKICLISRCFFGF